MEDMCLNLQILNMHQYNGFSSISQLGQKFRYNVSMPKAKQSTKTSAHHPCMGGTLDKLVQPAVLAILAKGPLFRRAALRR